MNIDELIKQEAGSDSEHDKYYADAIRTVYDVYKGMDKSQLLDYQIQAREQYRYSGATQHNTAACVVLYSMLK